MKWDKRYKIRLPDDSRITVEARKTLLKGYSKFKFFAHKRAGSWHVRELTTGLRVGSGTTEREAKQSARAYLAANSRGVSHLEALIADQIILNPEGDQ